MVVNNKARSVLIAVIVVGITTTLRVLSTGRVSFVGIDDANIYFTYVKNFLASQTISFSAGGEAVEGFTSLAWFGLLTAASSPFPAVAPFQDLVSLALTVTIAVVFFAVVHRIVEKHSPALALPVVVLIATLPGALDWLVLSRMETGLWTLVVLLSVSASTIQTIHPRRLIPLLALLPLVRPEGYALAPILALVAAFRLQTETASTTLFSVSKLFKDVTRLAIGPLAVIATIIVWRLVTFGVPLPMTYYAKVSSSFIVNASQGLRYLFVALITVGGIAVISAVSGFFRDRRFAWLAAVIAWLIVQPVLSGGDHFVYARFLFPAFALCWVAAGMTLGKTVSSRGQMWVAVVLLSLIQVAVFDVVPWKNKLRHEYKIADDGRHEARLIEAVHRNISPLPTWGVTSAGGTSYEYDGVCIDLLGLNNQQMAMANPSKVGGIRNHGSFSSDVFFQQTPDVLVVFGAPTREDAINHAKTDWGRRGIQRQLLRNLIDDKRYEALYEFAEMSRGRATYYAIVNKNWASGLPPPIEVSPFEIRTTQATE